MSISEVFTIKRTGSAANRSTVPKLSITFATLSSARTKRIGNNKMQNNDFAICCIIEYY
jgi:hypothetical protein